MWVHMVVSLPEACGNVGVQLGPRTLQPWPYNAVLREGFGE